MKKILQVATTGALMATMGVAMASDSMNGIQLSDKGLTLSINGTASLTVPNDEAQMNWSAMAQASTLQEATSQAVKAMNKGLSQIKAVSDQLQINYSFKRNTSILIRFTARQKAIKRQKLLLGV